MSKVLAALVVAATWGLPSAPATAAPLAPVPADEVGYVSFPSDSASYSFSLSCRSSEPVGREMFVHAFEIDGSFGTSVILDGRGSNTGHLVQVADKQVVFAERVENPGVQQFGLNLSASISSGYPGPVTVVLAWAVWDGHLDRDTCRVALNGSRVADEIRWFDGSRAVYIGPEAFTGGVFYQDGPTHVFAGRAYVAHPSGGQIFGALSTGQHIDFGHGAGWGAILTDTGKVRRCEVACAFGYAGVHTLVAEITAGVETRPFHGGGLWLLDVPPDSA